MPGRPGRARAAWVWAGLAALALGGCGPVLSTTRMGYSPDGRRLAFVTREPADASGLLLKGASAYRLMVVSGEDPKGLRLIETSTDAMLCAPTFSPDGKTLCYLRVPLVDQKLASELLRQAHQRAESAGQVLARLGEALPRADPNARPDEGDSVPPTQPSEQDPNRLPEANNPSLADVGYTYWLARTSPILSGELVFRDTRSYQVVRAVPADVPIMAMAMGEVPLLDIGAALFHGLFQLQFQPDGKWLYLWDGGRVLKVHAESGAKLVVQCAAFSFDLSPDGNCIGTFGPGILCLGHTESNEPLRSFAWNDGPIPALRWADNQTVLVPMGDDRLCWVRPDGWIVRSRELAFEPNGPSAGPMFWHLAADANGGAVVCAKGQALFLDADGRLIQRVAWSDALPVQPAYRPDGRRVAVQVVAKDEKKPDYLRVVAVAYFDPNGNELARVPVPRLPDSQAPRPHRDQNEAWPGAVFVPRATAPATAPAPPE